MAVPSFDDVYEDGRSAGRAAGRAEGRIETLLVTLKRLIEKMNMTADEAMECLDIPTEERAHFAALLKN